MLRIIALCLLFPFAGNAIEAKFNYNYFWSPVDGNYLETVVFVNSSTVKPSKLTNGKLQGQIEISLIISKNDTIAAFEKILLKGQEFDEKAPLTNHYLHLKRFVLAPGLYDLELSIKDVADTSNKVFTSTTIEILNRDTAISTSDLVFVDALTKSTTPTSLTRSGFEVQPAASDFYGMEKDTLIYFFEVYEASKYLKDSVYVATIRIQDLSTGLLEEKLMRFFKLKTNNVNVVFDKIPINWLASGSYALVLEIRDRENRLLTTNKRSFTKLNKDESLITNKLASVDLSNTFVDSMDLNQTFYVMRTMIPIANFSERAFIQKYPNANIRDLELQKKFVYDFWLKKYPENPKEGWENYNKQVDFVNRVYSSKVTKGFETDRGRVYLQYGEPNSRVIETNEPSAFPYEIWWYYRLPNQMNQTNVRFIFFNPDMVTNDYELLHSEAIGETNDPQWKTRLYSRTTPVNSIDQTEIRNPGHYGSFIEQNLRNQ